ncbi:hypothetical protein H2136_22910 [Aeromonas hydrophila]|uniref:Uncharacterized protein n=1 Tax=Aeromonas hydrophila TaxID=644 RepID=A0A926FPC5_AERHY|nr:hypothetical protein [Aeromonas hydrophila]
MKRKKSSKWRGRLGYRAASLGAMSPTIWPAPACRAGGVGLSIRTFWGLAGTCAAPAAGQHQGGGQTTGDHFGTLVFGIAELVSAEHKAENSMVPIRLPSRRIDTTRIAAMRMPPSGSPSALDIVRLVEAADMALDGLHPVNHPIRAGACGLR